MNRRSLVGRASAPKRKQTALDSSQESMFMRRHRDPWDHLYKSSGEASPTTIIEDSLATAHALLITSRLCEPDCKTTVCVLRQRWGNRHVYFENNRA